MNDLYSVQSYLKGLTRPETLFKRLRTLMEMTTSVILYHESQGKLTKVGVLLDQNAVSLA